MAFGIFKILKGLKITQENTLTPREIEIQPSGSAGTKTTIVSAQSANITVTLPNTTSVIATQAELNDHIINTVDAHDASAVSNLPSGNLSSTDVQSALNELQSDVDTRATDANLTSHSNATTEVHGVGTGSIVGTNLVQTLTNKTINADLNTITNIENADIKAGAAIDATKIADGTVDNTEFQRLSGVTGDIQTQIDGKESSFLVLPISKGGTNSNTALTNSKVMVSTAGSIVESATTTTQLSYLDATSSIQTQINSKIGILAVQTKTANYNALITDGTILCSGAAFTVTLYTAVGNAGREITIKKTDTTIANKITIAFNGAETADGASTLVLYAQYDEYTLISNGTNWSIKSKIIKPVVFVGTVSSNFAINASTPLSITESKDTHDAWSTNTFTVPYASDYILGFVASIATGVDNIQIYKNGTGFYLGGIITTSFTSFYIYMKDLAAGDTIQIRSSSAITITGNGNAQYSIRSV